MLKQLHFKLWMLTLIMLIGGSGLTISAQSDYSTDYTGNVTLSISGGTNAGACKISISNTQYDGIKAGTSSKAGAVKISVPASTKYLHLHVAGWNGETVSLAVTPTGYSSNISLTANSGISGNSPFTFSGDPSTSDYYKVITFESPLTASTDLTFTASSGKRFVVWGVTSEEDSGSSTSTVATPTISPNGSSFFTSQQVTLSCTTEDATIYYTLDGNDPTTSSTLYSAPFTITETTTVKAFAVLDDYDDSNVATAEFTKITPLANIAALTANTTAGTYYVSLDNAVVTYVKGVYAYIQDASGAVAMYSNEHGLTAGDVLTGTATVNYQVHNGNPQITDLSGVTPVNGTAPDPTSVAASAWNYTFNNVLSQYFKITGARITQSSNKYYVTLGGENIQLYKASGSISTLDLAKAYTITGFPTLYNTTKELQIFDDPEEEVNIEPVVSVSPTTVNVPAEGGEGTLTISYENITEFISFDFQFCDANGVELDEAPNWIDAEIQGENDNYSVYYLVGANDGQARTAYLKVYTLVGDDDDPDEVYSIVTITQDEYVAPTFAELPFTFNGGRADIEETDGLYQEGLDDYNASTNPNTKLKFDGTGDWLILQFNERPGILTFDIKNNSFSGGTFKVQTSADGVTYTDLKTYTEISGTQNEEFEELNQDVRYIKWIYTQKSSGNVGLGNISLAKYVKLSPVLTVTPSATNLESFEEANGELAISYKHFDLSSVSGHEFVFYNGEGENAQALEEAPDWIQLGVNNDYSKVTYSIGANDGEARTAYFKLVLEYGDEPEGLWSDMITINQAAYVAPFTSTTYSLASTIVSGKHYIIVNEDAGKAMGMQNTNNRAAVDVTISENQATVTSADVYEFQICGPDANGYYTIYDALTEGYLYAASSSSNHLKTQSTLNDNGKWTIKIGDGGVATIKSQGSNTRNLMGYNSQSTLFSCYSTGQGAICLYVKDNEATPTETVAITSAGMATYYSENSLDFTGFEDMWAYTAAVTSDGAITYTRINKVPARTAVVLYNPNKTSASHEVPVCTETPETVGTNNLIGTLTNIESLVSEDANGKNYILNVGSNGVGFYKANNQPLNAHRAYLRVPAGTSVRSFYGFNEGGVSTGIEELNSESMTDNRYYNLNGQQMAAPQKGLYIVNGKKVMVK